MDFSLSAEQRQFGAALHELLAAADCPTAARSWAAGDHSPGLKIWRALAGAGVTALAVPPEYGGLGAEPADLVIACEEIGHHALPGPAAETLAAVPSLIAAVTGSATGPEGEPGSGPGREPGTQAELVTALAALAGGDLIATLAAPPLLPYAADADVAGFVLLAGPQSLQAGSRGSARRSVDAARSLTEVTGGRVLAEGAAYQKAASRAADLGALANAAQLLGAGRALLEASARHARERVQFGQPVGSFQAVKHQLADVLIGLEFARPLLHAAAVALGAGEDSAPRDVSAAKVACADAAHRAARVGLQVHGAIGYTAEHDASLWITKIQALVPAWGSQAYHRARVLAAVTDPGERLTCG
jgi:alkylation response protein AidB-like acyl-CoA dehydrogenase